MKIVFSTILLSLSMTTFVFAESKAKAEKNRAAEPKAVAIAPKLVRNNEADIDGWKQIVSERFGNFTLKQKVDALTKLAETEGEDITRYLVAQKTILEADVKSGVLPSNKENRSFRFALDRIVATRNQSRVADLN